MHIRIESNIKQVLNEFERISNLGVQYAISNSINDVLFEMRQDLPVEEKRVFDNPVPFTLNPSAWGVQKAKRQAMIGVIKAQPLQAEYLRWQIGGGNETPKKRAIPVPTSTGTMKANHGGLKKTWKRAFGDDVRYFSGVPKVAASGGKVEPIPGLYRRMRKTKWNKQKKQHTGGYLRMEVSFESKTTYKPEWDFFGYSSRYFSARFEEKFRQRLREQLARQQAKK